MKPAQRGLFLAVFRVYVRARLSVAVFDRLRAVMVTFGGKGSLMVKDCQMRGKGQWREICSMTV
jgi:hypothetical protein